jgi:LysR family transcriptional regulator, nitrogen assimilation regulatory protein
VDVELLDLHYFVSIAETGSFTKSALQNNIAQSALSRRVRDVETEMGVQLFYRNGRGVLLTEVGETFLARARGILADMESLRQEMARTAGVLDGTVTLAVPPSVGLILLTPSAFAGQGRSSTHPDARAGRFQRPRGRLAAGQ